MQALPAAPIMPAPTRAVAAASAAFSVHACAEPGSLPRVVELLAKRGLTPSRLIASLVPFEAEASELQIDLQVPLMAAQGSRGDGRRDDGLPASDIDLVAQSLRSLPCVRLVLVAR